MTTKEKRKKKIILGFGHLASPDDEERWTERKEKKEKKKEGKNEEA